MINKYLLMGTIVLLGLGGIAHAEEIIVLASTTSVDNSGLMPHILPMFKARTGIDVHVLALGTGQALDTARRGDADLVLVHDPDAEAKFMTDGNGINRREIAWNDFVIVGPPPDPAHLKGSRDVVAGFKSIWTGGSPFVSRGDQSGTDALEKRIWKAAGFDPTKAGTWYKEIGGGMGADLNMAAATAAYTLVDRGTWLSFKNPGNLTILLEGDIALLNRYDVIELNPAKHPTAKLDLAKRFADWLVSPEAQTAIADYTVSGQKLFHPEADKKPGA